MLNIWKLLKKTWKFAIGFDFDASSVAEQQPSWSKCGNWKKKEIKSSKLIFKIWFLLELLRWPTKIPSSLRKHGVAKFSQNLIPTCWVDDTNISSSLRSGRLAWPKSDETFSTWFIKYSNPGFQFKRLHPPILAREIQSCSSSSS